MDTRLKSDIRQTFACIGVLMIVWMLVPLFGGLLEVAAQTPEYQRGPYLTHPELTQKLEDAAERAPDLVEMSSIATSPEGRNVWLIEIAAQRDQRPLDRRPAFLGNGTQHASELAGTNQCLYLMNYLIDNYGNDPRVTRILNEQVVYLVPRVAVDGGHHVVTTGELIRSREVDVKERNVPYPEDLNGDGFITRMRWQDPDGQYTPSEYDSRLLVPRKEGDTEGPFYRVAEEGIIHEWDGEHVWSSDIRVDFNRNYPANWEPFYNWIGHGRYPLSEPETKALAMVSLNHPNVVAATDYHTGNPAVWYPAKADPKFALNEDDVALYKRLGQEGVDHTGFPYIPGYSYDYLPLPGFYIDWQYQQRGILAFTLELGIFYNYIDYRDDLSRDEATGIAMLDWHDEHPNRGLFKEWEEYDHPQLGTVEIGGWNEILESNPPPAALDTVLENATQFALDQMEQVPRMDIRQVEVEKLADDLYKISARVVNTGPVSTSITRRGRTTHPGSEVRVEVTSGKDVEYVTGSAYQEIGHLAPHNGRRELEWVVRTDGSGVTLTASSVRGLWTEREVELE